VLTLCALLQHLGPHIEKAVFLAQAGYDRDEPYDAS
jgi:hypothetical protein